MKYNGTLQRRGISPRLKTFLLGAVYTIEGSEPAECVVIDFSATGAKIYIDPGLELPRQVRLTIKQRNLDLTCVVAHRSGETAGLKFVKDNLAERR
ncbi:PilZ domain-containing protein [Hyphomicrobium sp.]|uniref:PilZ domain-containing protein n=1 Tax=Hyphomicrobium sp. TaxID=82 RepID=UPI0025BCE7A8|nr:PilZ domain-containing protein [Hyphomicrobium sp.]